MPKLPGRAVAAQIMRSPRAGGAYAPVMNLTLRRVMGVLFQPYYRTVFDEAAGASLVKRTLVYADWPKGLADPNPIHPNDMLVVPFDDPVGATVLPGPPPTAAQVAVDPTLAQNFQVYGQVTVNGHPATLMSSVGGVLALQPALPVVPSAGQTVIQTGLQYAIEDADAYEGHHLEIYVRIAPVHGQ